MITELVPIDHDIQFHKAQVYFDGYETYKSQCQDIADYLTTIEVTPENIKEAKKIVASARKMVDTLNRRRIDLKKILLADYEVFETQVKDLAGIISDAEGMVRTQVRILDEQEREEKEDKLKGIWILRIGQYPFSEYSEEWFSRWLTPQHLNKSYSINKAEEDMTSWLEQRHRDLTALKTMDKDYLAEYLDCLDLTTAIQRVEDRKVREKAAEKVLKQEVSVDNRDADPAVTLLIRARDLKTVELVLKEYGIEYRIK